MKDLQIITFNPETHKAQVSFSRNNSYISGRDNAMQRLVKLLLTKTKSNFFAPKFGCDLLSLMGSVCPDDNNTTQAGLNFIITNILKNIQEEQIQNKFSGITLTDAEIITDLNLSKTEFDSIYGGWLVELEVGTQAGNNSNIQI